MVITNLCAQTYELLWINNLVASSNSSTGASIETDINGNVFIAIPFSDSIDADPGPNIKMLYENIKNGIMIGKWSGAGQLIWANAIEGNFVGQGMDISVDEMSNVYIASRFEDSIDADPGNSQYKLYGNGIELDFFMLKLNQNGDFLWAKSFGSNEFDFLTSSIVDSKGNFYVTGNFRGSMDFDPGPDTEIRVPGGLIDLFLLKLNSNGEFEWVIQYGGTDQPSGMSLHLDPYENIVIGGQFGNNSNFNPRGNPVYKTSNGKRDFFVARYTKNGELINVFTGGGSDHDLCTSVFFTADFGIYVSGNFVGNAVFDANNQNMNMTSKNAKDRFIARYDSTGKCLWRTQVPIIGTEFIYYYPVSADKNGSVYVVGDFRNKLDMDPSGDSLNFVSKGGVDLYLQKLNTDGQLIWAKQIGSKNDEKIYNLHIDHNNQIHIVGVYYDSCSFGIDSIPIVLRTKEISSNYFLLKYGNPSQTNLENVSVNQILVYPNPASDKIVLSNIPIGCSIKVINSQGIQIIEKTALHEIVEFSTENWSTGIYFIIFQINEHKFISKFIISK